jgi:hypothetical protein
MQKPPPEFSSLPLHDALLQSVEMQWEQKLCRIKVAAFVSREHSAVPYLLEFSGVTSLIMLHKEPWGPSSSVNSTAFASDTFRIEMQSGDIIELVASHFKFIAL